MRQVRYPLPQEETTEETAARIRQLLKDAVPQMAHGLTPMFQVLPGYPAAVQGDRASSIKDFLQQLSAFQAEVQAVRHAPRSERRERALTVWKTQGSNQPVLPSVALEIMYLLRDFAEWQDTLTFIDALPQPIRALPVVYEQRCLAQSKTGNHLEAIGALEQLIKASGATSEREGLLGGRYKRLWASATDPSDVDRARAAAEVARLACERSLQRNPDDEWARPTQLGMAFDAGDVTAAEEVAEQVMQEGAAKWKLDTTMGDLELTVTQTKEAEARSSLQTVVQRLKALL